MEMEKTLKPDDTTASIKPKDWSYWNIFYACLAILCCSILVCPITLAPQHNVFESPEYGYEFPIATTCCVLTYWSILAIIRLRVFFHDIGFVIKPTNSLSIFLGFAIPYNLVYCITYIIWTRYMNYNHPLPFMAYVPVWPAMLILFTTVWFQFRLEDRIRPRTRRRIKAYLLYYLLLFWNCTERNILTIIMLIIPTDVQPIMAIIMPIIRDLELWLLYKVEYIVADGENRDGKFLTTIEHNTNYTAFLAIALGQLATETTAYCILAVEFVLNMYKVFKIIKIGRKIKADEFERQKIDTVQKELIHDMVVVEIVEMILPIAYAISILMAYYGPNSEIMGNIRNDYWSYIKIENLGSLLAGIFKMFFIDVFSFLLGSGLIWKFSSFNCIIEGCKTMKRYWHFITVTLTGAVVRVCT